MERTLTAGAINNYALNSVEATRHGGGWRVVTQLDHRGTRYTGIATTAANDESPEYTVARATVLAATQEARVVFARRLSVNGSCHATVAIIVKGVQEVGTASHLRADEAIALATLDAIKKFRSPTPAYGWD